MGDIVRQDDAGDYARRISPGHSDFQRHCGAPHLTSGHPERVEKRGKEPAKPAVPEEDEFLENWRGSSTVYAGELLGQNKCHKSGLETFDPPQNFLEKASTRERLCKAVRWLWYGIYQGGGDESISDQLRILPQSPHV